MTPLFHAVELNKPASVYALVKLKADLNKRSEQRCARLAACWGCDIELELIVSGLKHFRCKRPYVILIGSVSLLWRPLVQREQCPMIMRQFLCAYK
jgi:hypothetical protein